MRILLASRNYFPEGVTGGGQVSVRLLGEALAQQGHEVSVLSLDRQSGRAPGPGGLDCHRLRLDNLYLRGPAPAWKKVLWHGIDRFGHRMDAAYGEVIATLRPDVINTNVLAGMGLGIWRAARAAGVPVVHTVHDYYLLCLTSGMRRGGRNCARPCGRCRHLALGPARAAIGAVQEVIHVSTHMRRAHERAGLFGPGCGVSVIAGICEAPAGLPPRSGPVRPGRLTLGFLGRLAPDKGLAGLIDALAARPGRDWELLVGGEGDPGMRAGLEARARGLPVRFLGRVEAAGFYARVDAVLVPSLWHDPAPRVAYEAGLHGAVPVVAARGGLPELVGAGSGDGMGTGIGAGIDTGISMGTRGLVFEPGDAAGLGRALDALGDPERMAVLREGWHAAAPRFARETVAARTLALYERALSRAPRPSPGSFPGLRGGGSIAAMPA